MGTRKVRPYILVRPPTRPSSGATTIRQALGDAVCRLSRIDPVPKQYLHVINWGNSTPLNHKSVLNKPSAIVAAVNKLQALTLWRDNGVRIPDFSSDSGTLNRSRIHLARTVLGGSGGDGIVVVRPKDEVPAAPLYVTYVPKLTELRLHVVRGRVVFMQAKRRKSDNEQTADQKLIRNYDNGWVFCPIEGEVVSEDSKQQAVNAVSVLGLDFGAVDVIVGRDDKLAYVLEVNTAPGLSSPGLIEAYSEAFSAELPRV